MSKEYTRQIASIGIIPLAGPILFHDNFNSLLHFSIAATEGDYIAELDPSISFIGPQSLNLKTRTTDTALDDHVTITASTHLHPSKIVALSTRFLSPDFSKMSSLLFTLVFYDGANIYATAIKFLPATPAFQYLSATDEFTPIPNSAYTPLINAWHSLTLKTDFLNNNYVSLDIDHLHFNLSSLNTILFAGDSEIGLTSETKIITAGASPAQLRIDEYSLIET